MIRVRLRSELGYDHTSRVRVKRGRVVTLARSRRLLLLLLRHIAHCLSNFINEVKVRLELRCDQSYGAIRVRVR